MQPKASFENKRLQERQKIADAAIAAGAFGGGREGVQRGVFDAQTNLGLAELEANLRAQGLQQAQGATSTGNQSVCCVERIRNKHKQTS